MEDMLNYFVPDGSCGGFFLFRFFFARPGFLSAVAALPRPLDFVHCGNDGGYLAISEIVVTAGGFDYPWCRAVAATLMTRRTRPGSIVPSARARHPVCRVVKGQSRQSCSWDSCCTFCKTD